MSLTTYGPSRIKLWAAIPAIGVEAILLNWEEPEGTVLKDYSEELRSPLLKDCGLSNPPGFGVWVFEGELTVIYANHDGPSVVYDWDWEAKWEGEWRLPNDQEITAWARHEAEHVTNDYSGLGSPNSTEELP